MKVVRKMIIFLLSIGLSSMLYSCIEPEPVEMKPEATQMKTITELAAMECYFHNVAKTKELDASGVLLWKKDKVFWIEYSGIVKIGIDPSLLVVEVDEEFVRIKIPEAKVLSHSVDSTALTEESFIIAKDSAKITAEDQTKAYAEAQEEMVRVASQDSILMESAQQRVKKLIEGYIRNIENVTGKTYTIEWIYLDENSDGQDLTHTEAETPISEDDEE